MKRYKMSKGQSRRNFARGNRVNKRNYANAPMRGGIRM